MEPGTAASLQWIDVHLEKSGEYEYGFVHDGCQKTKSRERDIPLTARLQTALRERAVRMASWPSAWVFPAEKRSLKPTPLSTFQSRHKRLWTSNKVTLPPFRLYDFRHTALTRLRDSGADRFELALYAGWAPGSRMADTYVHAGHSAKAAAGLRLSAHVDAISNHE